MRLTTPSLLTVLLLVALPDCLLSSDGGHKTSDAGVSTTCCYQGNGFCQCADVKGECQSSPLFTVVDSCPTNQHGTGGAAGSSVAGGSAGHAQNVGGQTARGAGGFVGLGGSAGKANQASGGSYGKGGSSNPIGNPATQTGYLCCQADYERSACFCYYTERECSSYPMGNLRDGFSSPCVAGAGFTCCSQQNNMPDYMNGYYCHCFWSSGPQYCANEAAAEGAINVASCPANKNGQASTRQPTP